METYTVKMLWDNGYWHSSAEAPLCMTLESDSYDKLVKRVCIAAPEIIELNTGSTEPFKLVFISERAEIVSEVA